MTHVASEMERQGFTIPLLIGGATTSRTHTAVKIAPDYSGPVVHVIDASRAVGVAGALVQPDRRDAFVAGIRDEYETVRRERAGQRAKEKRLTLAEARANHVPIDWSAVDPAAPDVPRAADVRRLPARRARRLHRLDAVLHDLGDARRLPGDPRRSAARCRGARPPSRRAGPARPARRRGAADGERGRRLLAGQQRRRRRHHRLVRRRPAGAAGDFRTLRQQMAKPDGRPNVALADFVAPAETGRGRLHRRLRGHDRASASTRSSPSSRRPTTTTRRSSPRPSPTAWPRPSPSGSTSASGASCGATRPTRRSRTPT